jgi:hypothetical protein
MILDSDYEFRTCPRDFTYTEELICPDGSVHRRARLNTGTFGESAEDFFYRVCPQAFHDESKFFFPQTSSILYESAACEWLIRFPDSLVKGFRKQHPVYGLATCARTDGSFLYSRYDPDLYTWVFTEIHFNTDPVIWHSDFYTEVVENWVTK